MSNYLLWEDPFEEQALPQKGPPIIDVATPTPPQTTTDLWNPEMLLSSRKLKSISSFYGVISPPTDLSVIRKRQSRLLPHIDKLRETAFQILGQIRSDKNSGGQFLLNRSAYELLVRVFFRFPDQPDVITTFGPHTVSDHAVVLPVEGELKPSLLNRLFPVHHIYEVPRSDARQQHLIDATEGTGLVLGVGAGSKTSTRVVVFPRLLDFVTGWIAKVESPIFDIQFVVREEGTGPASRRPKKITPPAPKGVN